MKRLLKIGFLILAMAVGSFASQPVTTGELIQLLSSSSELPPMILVRPSLPLKYETENFCIHYDTTGTFAVYRPSEDIDPLDGIPDYINRMAEYLEESHHIFVGVLGFDPPASDEGLGGNGKYDIYVTDIAGLTVPEARSNHYPNRLAYIAYTYIGNDLRNQNHPSDPLPLLKATCAHEYFHAIQMVYRAYTTDETVWWYEITANWAEERVFDDLNEVYYYLRDYYSKIDKSLYYTGGSFMYGAWPFAEYLSQNYGDDIIRRIFVQLINLNQSLSAIDQVLGNYGSSLGKAFTAFGGWNYFTNDNWQPGFFEEGMDFPVTVPIAVTHMAYPTGIIETPQALENMGIAYIFFGSANTTKPSLAISFTSGENNKIDLALGIIRQNQPVAYSTYELDKGERLTLRIRDFSSSQGAVLAVNWPYQGTISYDSADYHYEAKLDTNFTGITDNETITPERFELLGNYPNPFNSSSIIFFNWNLAPANYTIAMYDIGGRLIDSRTGLAYTGTNKINWTAPGELAGGVYFYRLSLDGYHLDGKMLFLK
jgi:hypothetical protein